MGYDAKSLVESILSRHDVPLDDSLVWDLLELMRDAMNWAYKEIKEVR